MKTLAAIWCAFALAILAGCGANTTTSYNETEPPTQHLPTVTQAVVQPAHTTTQTITHTVHAKPHTHEIGAVVENPNEPAEHDELEEEEGVK